MTYIDEKTYRELTQQQTWGQAFKKAAAAGHKNTILSQLVEYDQKLSHALSRDMNATICANPMYGPEKQSHFAFHLFQILINAYFQALAYDRRQVFHLLKDKIEDTLQKKQPYFEPQTLWEQAIFSQGKLLGRTQVYYLEFLLPLMCLSHKNRHTFISHLSESIGRSLNHKAFDFFIQNTKDNTQFLNPKILYYYAYQLTPRSSNISYLGEQEELIEKILQCPLFDKINTDESILSTSFHEPKNARVLGFVLQQGLILKPEHIVYFFERLPHHFIQEKEEKKQIAQIYIQYMFEQGLRQTLKTVEKNLKRELYQSVGTKKEFFLDLCQTIEAIREKQSLAHHVPLFQAPQESPQVDICENFKSENAEKKKYKI